MVRTPGTLPFQSQQITTMTITKEQSAEMLEAAKPLIQWINENCHPHTQIILDQTHVQLLEGVASNMTKEFLKD